MPKNNMVNKLQRLGKATQKGKKLANSSGAYGKRGADKKKAIANAKMAGYSLRGSVQPKMKSNGGKKVKGSIKALTKSGG